MNYKRIYSQIIERAKVRKLEGYKEKHHIIPRCLGGGDESTNLVDLTAREHIFVHRLLTKMHPGNEDLISACFFMYHERGYSSKVSASLREQYARNVSEFQKGKTMSERLGRDWVNPRKGKTYKEQYGEDWVDPKLRPITIRSSKGVQSFKGIVECMKETKLCKHIIWNIIKNGSHQIKRRKRTSHTFKHHEVITLEKYES